MIRYRALTLLTHAPTGGLIRPGWEVDLTHLTPDEILMLCDLGVVEPIPNATEGAAGAQAADSAAEEG